MACFVKIYRCDDPPIGECSCGHMQQIDPEDVTAEMAVFRCKGCGRLNSELFVYPADDPFTGRGYCSLGWQCRMHEYGSYEGQGFF